MGQPALCILRAADGYRSRENSRIVMDLAPVGCKSRKPLFFMAVGPIALPWSRQKSQIEKQAASTFEESP
jgi:hypothetical protein